MGEMALLGVATHKLAGLITKDRVTAPLRAPFVTYKKGAGDGEVEEDSRRTGDLREAVGDLVTCPYCIGVWVATPMWFGMMLAPRLNKFVAGTLVTMTGADFMHRAYLQAKRGGEGGGSSPPNFELAGYVSRVISARRTVRCPQIGIDFPVRL